MSEIDWGLQRPAPDLSSGFLQSYEAGRAMGRQRQADQAWATLQQNPNDQNALLTLAGTDPQRAAVVQNALATQRALTARQLAAQAGSSMVGGGAPQQNAMASPAPMAAPTSAPTPMAAPTAAAPNATPQPRVIDVPGLGPSPLGVQPATATQAPPAGPNAPATGTASQGAPAGDAAALTNSPLNPAHPAAQQIGAMATTGQDYRTLMARAWAADPATAEASLKFFQGMRDDQRQQFETANEHFAREGMSLLQSFPMPANATPEQQQAVVAQRRQAAMGQMQQLSAYGLQPAQVANADYSDAGLHGLVGSAITAQAAIEQANKDREFNKPVAVGMDQRFVKPDGTVVLDGNAKGVLQSVTNADGTTSSRLVNPYTGAEVGGAMGGGGGSAGGAPAGKGATALSGNNPGGIVDSPFARAQPGYTGTNGRFAAFDSLQAGVAAQTKLLQSYVQRGFDTPAKIANRWAPAGDGGNNPTQYAANIARSMGIGPNDKIGPSQIAAFQQAQAKQENSMYQAPSGAAPSGGGSTMSGSTGKFGGFPTQGALDFAANMYLMDPHSVGSLGRNGATQKAVIARANEIAGQQGMTPADVVAGRASQFASKAALSTLDKQAATVLAAERAAESNANLVLQKGAANGNGNIPLFNAWRNAGGKATGDPAISGFNTAVEGLVTEYATVMGRGTPTDSLRQHGYDMINTAQSPQQLAEVVSTMRNDMANRRGGFAQERQAIMSRMSGSNNGGSGDVIHYARNAQGKVLKSVNGGPWQ